MKEVGMIIFLAEFRIILRVEKLLWIWQFSAILEMLGTFADIFLT